MGVMWADTIPEALTISAEQRRLEVIIRRNVFGDNLTNFDFQIIAERDHLRFEIVCVIQFQYHNTTTPPGYYYQLSLPKTSFEEELVQPLNLQISKHYYEFISTVTEDTLAALHPRPLMPIAYY